MPRKNIVRAAVKNASTSTDRKFVTALARGLQILGEFENETELGNLDIAERAGLPRATVSRLTYTLTTLGYLRQMPNGKYCPGVGFLGLSASIERNIGVRRVARPLMQALASDLNCTVVMAMRDGASMVFIEVARPTWSGLTLNSDAGSSVPIHHTSVGLAWLMAAPLNEREQVLGALRIECGDEWETFRHAIEQSHALYRRQGFVIQLRSWHRDVNAVAVPLKAESMQNVYSFFCAGPTHTMTRSLLIKLYGPRLKTMVAQVKTQLEPKLLPKRTPPQRKLRSDA